MLGHHDALYPGAFRRADNGAQVLRVFNAVQQQNERGFLAFSGVFQDFWNGGVGKQIDFRYHPLMIERRHLIQDLFIRALDEHIPFLGQGGQFFQAGTAAALLKVYFMQLALTL
jgi:hypothetical protein